MYSFYGRSYSRNEFKKVVSKNILWSSITDKYIDTSNHSYQVIEFANGLDSAILFLNLDKSGLFNFISIGDSIYKPVGDSTITVIRNNSKVFFTLKYD